jgi:DNA-binding NtrC family response regulator
VIDDDAPLLRSYGRWLSRRYDVQTAPSAAAAIEAIERGPSFDAILCDVVMPGVSGLDLYRSVEGRWPQLAERVVFVTGGAISRDAQDSLERTGRPTLYKPFDIHDLDVCLGKTLGVDALRRTAR